MYTLLRNLITPLSQNSPMRKIDKKKLRNSSNFCHPLPSPNFLNTGNSTLKFTSRKYFQFNIETCFNAYQGVIFSGLLVRQTSLQRRKIVLSKKIHFWVKYLKCFFLVWIVSSHLKYGGRLSKNPKLSSKIHKLKQNMYLGINFIFQITKQTIINRLVRIFTLNNTNFSHKS